MCDLFKCLYDKAKYEIINNHLSTVYKLDVHNLRMNPNLLN